MPFSIVGYRVLISSPSDAVVNRNLLQETLSEWNLANSTRTGKCFLPVMWEYHVTPAYGKRPQSSINDQLLEQSDLAIAVFGTRIGTPTGEFPSGTVEEIEKMHDQDKEVWVYFFNGGFSLTEEGLQSATKILEFKKTIQDKCLWNEFSNEIQLKDQIMRHLSKYAEDNRIEDRPSVGDQSAESESPVQNSIARISSFETTMSSMRTHMDGPSLTVGVKCSNSITPFESEQKISALSLAEQLYINSNEYYFDSKFRKNFSVNYAFIEILGEYSRVDFSLSVNVDGSLYIQKSLETESASLSLEYVKSEYLRLFDAITNWLNQVNCNASIVATGIHVSNWPACGLNTDSLFKCIYPDDLAGGSGHREIIESSVPIDHRELFRTFVYNALNKNGYLDFEEGVRNLTI